MSALQYGTGTDATITLHVADHGAETCQGHPTCSTACDYSDATPTKPCCAAAEGTQEPPRSWSEIFVLSVVTILVGMGEGVFHHRCLTYLPQAMFDQMLMRKFIIMKMFVAAVGSSMVFQGIFSWFNRESFERTRFYKRMSFGYARVIGGCAVLGVGMSTSGCGPTILPPSIGAGVVSGVYIFLGGIAGAVLFALVEEHVFPSLKTPVRRGVAVVDDLIPLPYHVLAIAGGLVMLATAALLEAFIPFQEESDALGIVQWQAWPPMAGGVAIGFSMIVVRIISGDGKGGSTSFMNIVATVSFGSLSSRHRVTKWGDAFQLMYVYGGTALGAFFSACVAYEGVPPDTYGFSPQRSVIGGMLMVVGARLAGGCTCGHGISGTSELALESIAGTCAIFGGGIATAFIINAIPGA